MKTSTIVKILGGLLVLPWLIRVLTYGFTRLFMAVDNGVHDAERDEQERRKYREEDD